MASGLIRPWHLAQARTSTAKVLARSSAHGRYPLGRPRPVGLGSRRRRSDEVGRAMAYLAARCRRRTQPRDGSPADLHSRDGQPCTIVLNPPKAIRPGTNGMSGGIVDFFISAITRLLTAFRWAFDL